MNQNAEQVYARASRAFIFIVALQVLIELDLVGLTAYVSGLRGLVHDAPMLGLLTVMQVFLAALMYRILLRLRERVAKHGENVVA